MSDSKQALQSRLSVPWYRAAHRGLETCAFPGECDLEASEELLVEDIPLGFCKGHTILLESFAVEASETEEVSTETASVWDRLVLAFSGKAAKR